MKRIYRLICACIMVISVASCGSATMAQQHHKKFKSPNIAHYEKRYKHLKDCEEKFMKRFNRLYAKQQRQAETEDMSTPFFSSYTFYKR